METLKKINNKNILKISIVLCSFLFAIPSIIYLLQNKTVLNFTNEYCFLLNNSDRVFQTGIYLLIIGLFCILYYLIIKNRKKVFTNIKQILLIVLIVSVFFMVVIPFESSDVFYYLGIGRIQSEYGQNPYYISVKDYVDNNNVDMEKDTALQKGYNNYWSETTVVYGAIWTLVCRIIAGLSFGSVDIGVFLFKVLNLVVHIFNCYMIYKISHKKIFSIIYGLNPFVLIEAISNVHNDIFVIAFILIATYFLIRKKNLFVTTLFLSFATAIKYFAILLLPIMIIYYFRKEKPQTRFINCIKYGLLFVAFLIIPYLLYMQDLQVFKGMADQQGKVTKGIYVLIAEYFTEPANLVGKISSLALGIFIIVYFFKCIMLLAKPQISFRKEMQSFYWMLLVFIFVLITAFQPWYLMWLCPIIMWQKSKGIKLITQMQIMTLIANIVFLIYSENYRYGVPFFFIFVVGTLLCVIRNNNKKVINKKI